MNGWHASVRALVGGFEIDVTLGGNANPLALIGTNGSGKTTFLRLLAGAMEADEAEIVVAGRVLTSTRDGIQVPIERRRVGYVPQGYGLFPHLGVLDNVAFGLSTGRQKVPRHERRRLAHHILDRLGCASLADREVAGLSGGEQQRVALARALVIKPTMLLLDEPLAALDATSRRAVRRFLATHLKGFGGPTLLVTHDVRDVVALGAEICVLEQGRVLQTGTPETLRSNPASEFVAEFVGGSDPVDPADPGSQRLP